MVPGAKVPMRDSIATRMLLVVLGLYLLIATGVTLCHVWMEYSHQKTSIIRDLEDIEAAFGEPLAVSMWAMNTEALKASVKNMLQIPTVVGVEVRGDEGDTLAIGGVVTRDGNTGNVALAVNLSGCSEDQTTVRPDDSGDFEMFRRQFPIASDDEVMSMTLGTATVYSSSSVIYDRMKLQIIMSIVSIVLTLLTSFLAVLWAANRYLRKPLGILTTATADVSYENLGSFSVDIETSRHNEIQVLAKTITSMVSDLHDAVEQRKEFEASLRRGEAKFRGLVESSSDWIWEVDCEGLYTFASSRVEEILGYRPEEMIGKSPFDFMPPSEARRVRELFQQTARAKQPLAALENVNLHRDGRRVVLETNGVPITDDSGALIGYRGVDRDVTDRKRTEEALTKRVLALTRPLDDPESVGFEDLFNLDDIQRLQDDFARASGVASVITRTDGTPITTASNSCRLCSEVIRKTDKGLANCLKSDAELGRHDPEGPTIRRCMSCGLWDAGAAITVGGKHVANWLIGQVRDETNTVEAIRGYAREIGADEEQAALAFDEVRQMPREQFTNVARALFTLADQLSTTAYQNVQQARFITERKEAEAQRDQLEEQLRQAQKMEAVGQLAGGIAHDFNNILAAIMGNAELLKMDPPSDGQQTQFADEIIKGAARAADLTRQLLAFARKGKWRVVPADVHEIVDQTVAILSHSIDRRIEIRLKLNASPHTVTGDPAQLENALLNLGVNARDAMPDGGVLTYATRNVTLTDVDCQQHPYELSPGEFIEIRVSDTGVGMDNRTRQRIFEPFFTTKDIGKGTGLGLAGVYGCVRSHEGSISASSSPGRGAEFTILLPSAEIETETAAQPPPHSAPTKGTGHILVVDDEQSLREFMRTTMRHLGYEVSLCSEGAEAVEYYRKHHREIDLVILDLIMPQMSGQDAFREMKKIDPGVRVLVASGFSGNQAISEMLKEGALALLSKPFKISELSEAAARYIRGGG